MSDKMPPAAGGDGVRAHKPAPIETARLRLRIFRLEDLDVLADLFADPAVMRYVADGKTATREEAEKALIGIMAHWYQHGFGRWAIEDRVTREFVGFGGLRLLFGTPEVVYHLASAHWGKGLATEIGRASLKFGFGHHRFERIVAVAKRENSASIRVMEKLGMRFEKDANYYGIDCVQYEITADEFKDRGAD